MNSIRKLVSGTRRRYNEGDYSLDLTYITPRLVAMGYPSTGFESLYRNPVEKVMIIVIYTHSFLIHKGICIFE